MSLDSANLVAKAVHRLRREEKKDRVYKMYKPACFFLRMVLEGRPISVHTPQSRDRRVGLFYQFAHVVESGIPIFIPERDINLPIKRIKLNLEDSLKTDLIEFGKQSLYYYGISGNT
jgi:hypothetical protein